jgi:transcriptional regulator with XRE-family HTH domain
MNEDAEDLTTAIGQRLRAQRLVLGLSLNELSERTGGALSKSRISNYEQGIRRMGVEQARLLSQALGTVSPAYLLYVENEHPLSPEELGLVETFRGLSPEIQQVIRRAMGLG